MDSLARGRVLGARFDDGLGFKACESSSKGTGTDSLSCLSLSSPPPPGHRICLIVGTNHEKYIYILSLGLGGGDTHTSVDGYEPRPNLRIPLSFRDFRFCVVDSTLYALKIRWNWRYDLAADHDEVYTLRLSDKLSDVVLDDKMLEKVPVLLSPKEAALPLPLPAGRSLLFMSTFIRFHSELDLYYSLRKHVCDFEIYDTIHNVVRKLPQLWIRPKNRSRFCTTYQLFHPNFPHPREWEDFPIFYSHPHSTPPVYFRICAYAFHHTLFLIQTNFGRVFGIDTSQSRAQWQLMDKDMNLKGQGHSCDPNFMILGGQLCVDAFGIHRFQGSASGVEFPLSYFPSASRSLTFLDSCTLCIVRATMDPSCYGDCYDFSTTACWCVDVIKVDFPNLLVEIDKDGGVEKKVCIIKDGNVKKSEHVNNTMSFKFCIKDKKAHSIYVDGMFPF